VTARTLDIAATSRAPTDARRWLDGLSELRALGQVAFDVRLLITELVANSVRHAGLDEHDQIEVTLDIRESVLRGEVVDPGPGFTVPARPTSRTAASGRGLQILAAIASRWGISGGRPVTVWFEIDLRTGSVTPLPSMPRRMRVPHTRH
jgi:anti-sigma regulatory factor (Ser/Thr protein kinase)